MEFDQKLHDLWEMCWKDATQGGCIKCLRIVDNICDITDILWTGLTWEKCVFMLCRFTKNTCSNIHWVYKWLNIANGRWHPSLDSDPLVSLRDLSGRVTFLYSVHVAALVRSCMNGLQPFESMIEQTKETMPPSPETITAATMIKQQQLTTAATLMLYS